VRKSIKIPNTVIQIIRRITNAKHEAYVVGGVLRDILLKRKEGDYDIATSAKPKQISKLFKKTIPTGIKHGTVTVIEAGRPFEITTFRKEGKYTDGRRPDEVKFIRSLKEDLSRRDFTINAIAYDIFSKELIDPFNGIKDLRKKIIRTVGDPKKRFSEDSLRVIRAARFAALLNFKIERKTRAAMPKMLAKIRNLSNERIRDEIMKMLGAKKPSIGINILKEIGVLDLLIPEFKKAHRFDQGGFHEYDLLKHSLIAMDRANPKRPLLRLACFLHDIGKIQTRIVVDKDYRFYGHENKSDEIVHKVMKRLKFSNKDISYVTNLIKNHMFNYTESWKDGAIRRLLSRVGTESISDLMELRVADIKACGKNRRPSKELTELQKRIEKITKDDLALKITDLKVDGIDVMKILKLKPGRRVGEMLSKLLNIVLEDEKKNTKKELKKIMKTF